ncbi:MAG: PAS domain S-box protein, partial [Rhodocyclaceae bacterium]
ALAEKYRADDLSVLQSGKSKVVEEEIAVPGRRFWSETYKSPVELDGHIIGTVGFARDITERMTTEAELRNRYEELQRFNRVMVGREMEMISLKQQVNALSLALGRAAPYALSFLDAERSDFSPPGDKA